MLLVAGHGSGKTLVLVTRVLNILFKGLADPKEALIFTFTEKAAYELRDRISAVARKLNYQRDLSELQLKTIHGISINLVVAHRYLTPLGNNYEVIEPVSVACMYEHGAQHEWRHCSDHGFSPINGECQKQGGALLLYYFPRMCWKG